MKTWVCTPINPNSKQHEELIMINFKMIESSRFVHLHYLQNLIFHYENKFADLSIRSNECLNELKSKIGSILNEFDRKVMKIKSNDKTTSSFLNDINFNFEYLDIFSKNTSFIKLDYATKILQLTILNILDDIEPKFSSSKFESANQNILYLLETLISFENNLKNLLNIEKYFNFAKNNEYLCKQIDKLKEVTSLRILNIIKRDYQNEEKFITQYGDTLMLKIKEIICY